MLSQLSSISALVAWRDKTLSGLFSRLVANFCMVPQLNHMLFSSSALLALSLPLLLSPWCFVCGMAGLILHIVPTLYY